MNDVRGVDAISWDFADTGEKLAELERALVSRGVRKLPYPFETAFALTSDIDRCITRHYEAYTEQMVRRHGLDFGDSVWLQTNRCGGYSGLAFMSPNYSFWTKRTLTRSDEFDQHSLVREYHLGNIDHWHCFMVRGPRFVALDMRASGTAGELVVDVRETGRRLIDPYYGVQQFQIAAVSLAVAGGAEIDVESVSIVTKKASYTYSDFADGDMITAHSSQATEDVQLVFLPFEMDLHSDAEVPQLLDVERMSIRLRSGSPANVKRVFLYNIYSDLLMDRVLYLQRTFNIRTNLLTIHGQWMIPHHGKYVSQAAEFERRAAKPSDTLESLYGSGVVDGVRFSTVADERSSFARLYPELLQACGIGFWRPTGSADIDRGMSDLERTSYCDILDVITPAVRRDGGGIYLVTTTKGRVRRLSGEPSHDRKSTARNFPERLGVILDDFRTQPGRVAVMYTHLGNLAPDNRVRTPYFPESLFRRLRCLCHGISHQEGDGPRLWFTRASVMCDYTLLLRQIADHVERPDTNTVVVRRWRDPHLDTELPRDAYQMYGLTFYVDDPHEARVFLEHEEIFDLVRNPPDETGRGSVTLAACGIGQVVLGRLDPAEAAGTLMPTAGKQAVHTHLLERGVRFLRVAAREKAGWRNRCRRGTGVYGVGIACKELRIDGAQQLRVVLRKGTADSRVGLLLRTAGRGRFYFGDESLQPSTGVITASNTAAFARVGTTAWFTAIVPFYALDWNIEPGEDPLEAQLPSSGAVAIDVLVAGGEDARVDVSEIAFGRPRTVGAGGERRVVIGGRVKPAREGVVVHLRRVDAPGNEEVRSKTDELGGVVFPPMPPGGYEVWCGEKGRKRRLECLYDRYDLNLHE